MHQIICCLLSTGATIGGHLLEGNEVFTTAEIVIGEANTSGFIGKQIR